MQRQPLLSLLVPVFNEEDSLPLFFQTVIPLLEAITPDWEIVCVNDGSRDTTLEVLRATHLQEPRVRAIDFSRNFGKEAALSAGLDYVRGRAVVPMDVDLQDPPELIAEMVAKWKEGYDVVLARRVDRSSDSYAKRVTAGFFYRIIDAMSSIEIPANVGDFRLMDARVVAALRAYPERMRFMKGIFASVGFKQAIIDYVRPARSAGETKFRAWRLWTLALEGLISFSTKPLKIWTYIGIIVSAVSLLYLVWIVIKTLTMGVDVAGYASLMSAMLFFNGLILTGLGVIGEYIARIFAEVKNRPIYLVREAIGIEDAPEARIAHASPQLVSAVRSPDAGTING